MGTMIKFLIYAIAMNVIYFAINSLYNRKNILSGSDQNGSCYIVKMPKALKYVYTAFFGLGLFMFCVFFPKNKYSKETRSAAEVDQPLKRRKNPRDFYSIKYTCKPEAITLPFSRTSPQRQRFFLTVHTSLHQGCKY